MFIHSLAAAQGTNQKQHQDINGITINTVLVRPDLHTQNKFSGNYPQFGTRLQKFHLPHIKKKKLKEYRFHGGAKILTSPGRPRVYSLALFIH
jgi:hypothetical protein